MQRLKARCMPHGAQASFCTTFTYNIQHCILFPQKLVCCVFLCTVTALITNRKGRGSAQYKFFHSYVFRNIEFAVFALLARPPFQPSFAIFVLIQQFRKRCVFPFKAVFLQVIDFLRNLFRQKRHAIFLAPNRHRFFRSPPYNLNAVLGFQIVQVILRSLILDTRIKKHIRNLPPIPNSFQQVKHYIAITAAGNTANRVLVAVQQQIRFLHRI